MTLMDVISVTSFLIAIASICVNLIQFYRKKSMTEAFEAYVRSSYNADHMIARSCARMRQRFDREYDQEKLLHYFWCELQAITGVVDAARGSAVFVAETHLGFTPSFRHVADPSQPPDAATVLGQAPEKRHLFDNVDKYGTAPGVTAPTRRTEDA